MVEKDWLLFWKFLVNQDFRKCFIIAKYLGWEENPKQMIQMIQHNNPFIFYELSSKKNFYNIILIGKNEVEIEKFLKMMRAKTIKMEVDNFTLISNNLKKDLIIKNVVHQEILSNSYNIANYSNFDSIWFLDSSENELKADFHKLNQQLPANIPKLGVSFEAIYERDIENENLSVICSLDDQPSISFDKLSSLMDSQSKIMNKKHLGFSGDFIKQNEEPKLFNKTILVAISLGIGGILAFFYFQKKGKTK